MKIDGKNYNVVKIGNQYWLAQNYRNSANEEHLTWIEAVEVAEKNDCLRLPTDADWLELKKWVKGKFPTQPEDGILKDSSWGGKKSFCEKCGFGALPAGYIFTDQKKVKDSNK